MILENKEKLMPLHENRSLVRLTIFLSKAERRAFKEYAARTDQSMNSIVVDHIRSLIREPKTIEKEVE
jgi:hypothetical protein